MAIFDKILKGLGFESKDYEQTVLKVERQKDSDANYQNFNLHESEEKPVLNRQQPIGAQSSVSINSLVVHSPKNHKDMQVIVDYLIKGQASIVNLQGLDPSDKDRILDFLSGAVYATNSKINRLQGDMFIIVPNNLKIVELVG